LPATTKSIWQQKYCPLGKTVDRTQEWDLKEDEEKGMKQQRNS